MGMSSVLSAALSGLRASQAGLDLVSRNVANADLPGYTKKTLAHSPLVAGGDVVGIRIGDVNRQLDTFVLRQMWRETSGGGYVDTLSRYFSHVDTMLGAPGSPAGLDSLYNGFLASLEGLSTSPDSFTARDKALRDAQALAQTLNQTSHDIQMLRQEAEGGIANAVKRVNELLKQISGLNRDISARASAGMAPPDLLDLRDARIVELSKLIDVKVVERDHGNVALFTQSGTLLLDLTPGELIFDGRGGMSPQTLYSKDDAERGVGTIRLASANGSVIDLIQDRAIRSGELAALIELRDTHLVQAQEQLDAFADAMSRALSTNAVSGEPVTDGDLAGFELDLAALLAGDRFSLQYEVDGVTEQVTFVRVDDPATLPLPAGAVPGAPGSVVGIDFSGGWADVAAQISAALGGSVTVQDLGGGQIRILDDGPPETVSAGGLYPGNGQTLDLSALDGETLTVAIDGQPDQIFTFDPTSTGEDLLNFLDAVAGLSATIDSDDNLVVAADPPNTGFSISFSSPTVGVETGLSEGSHGRGSIAALSAEVTATGFHDGLGLPLFVDGPGNEPYSGSFDGTPQQRGFAGRIRVNPALLADNTMLVKFDANVAIGDSARPIDILNRLTQEVRHFAAEQGAPGGTGYSGTVGGFLHRVISFQASQQADAARAKEAQGVVLAQLEERFTRESGVNIDEEMARLIELQTAFQANTRVVQAYREMMAMLMQW